MSLLDTASLIVTPNGVKEGKLYSVIPSDGSGDMSVVRATTATRVNSSGLVELVPYNLLNWSEAFDDSIWVQDNGSGTGSITVTANYAAAPDGTMTADRLQIVRGSVYSQAFQLVNVVAGNQYTISVYLKSLSGTPNISTLYDVNLGVVGQQTLTTDWVRYTYTFTASTSSVYPLIGLYNTNSANADILAWGYQINEGTILPYQKTETRLNIPRLDYSNGTCPSLLVEPQRTNLLTYSSSFDNAAWGNPASVTANSVISPSGIQDADRVTGILSQLEAFTSGQAYTLSFYAKKNTSSSFAMRLDATANNTFTYNFDTETASSGATIEEFGNGWYYCSAVVTANATATGVVYLNVNSDDFYLWGAQLEAGSYSTSYIPTTSASVTRNADVISKTGISSLIGQTEGTMFVEEIFDASVQNNGGLDDALISLTDGTANNLISVFHYGSNVGVAQQVLFFVRLGGATQAAIFSSALPSGTYKIALAYKNNDVVGYINGVQIGTDTSASIPTTSAVTFVDPITTNAATKTVNIKAAALWQTRLTNDELATLTTI